MLLEEYDEYFARAKMFTKIHAAKAEEGGGATTSGEEKEHGVRYEGWELAVRIWEGKQQQLPKREKDQLRRKHERQKAKRWIRKSLRRL